jgi:hypothetical protein
MLAESQAGGSHAGSSHAGGGPFVAVPRPACRLEMKYVGLSAVAILHFAGERHANMSNITGPKFSCPSCAKEYRWKPELAGKKGKCKCGGVLAIPASPPRAAEAEPDAFDDPYDVADEPVQQASTYAPAQAPTTTMTAPAATSASRSTASTSVSSGADDGGGAKRELHVVPALKWIGIGVLVGAFALWELSSPTDPDAPARRLKAVLALANKIHPMGSFFVLAAFAAFMLVIGVLILFGKAKDDDYEHEKQKGQWPASRGRR